MAMDMNLQLLSDATAEWNSGEYGDELAWVCEPDEVVVTAETVADFIKARGNPAEVFQTEAGDLHIWCKQQSRPGCRRGDLFLLDIGDSRLSYFDGEG